MPEFGISNAPKLDYACQEAINTLCTNLSFLGTEKRKLVITSSQAHEGKSFVSFMVAQTLSMLGHSVVLVDADLRRSQMTARYGFSFPQGSGLGLAHYLAGKCPMGETLHYSRNLPMCLIPVGRTVLNPLTLLSSPKLPLLLDKLSKQFEFVIVDAPPLGAVIDAAEIAKHCDGSVVVIKYNNVSYREAQDVKTQLENVQCPILGAVLNDVAFDSISSKKYYNKSYYSRYESNYYKTERTKSKGTPS